jgi:inorganic pyrophosphatase
MKKIAIYLILVSVLLLSCITQENTDDRIGIIDTHNFLTDFSAFTSDSLVNVVVEIPAGSNEKWEVDKVTGFLEWERINEDSLRVVQYLPYPANYGMVPQTLLPADKGGDNDPLDVFLLGLSIERGLVVPGRIVGVIKMLDKGFQDDKLIAVPVSGLFSEIETLQQLIEQYPGVLDQISLWLASYKRGGKVEILGIGDEKEAVRFLKLANTNYLELKSK